MTTGDPSEEVRTLARGCRVNILRVDEGGSNSAGEELAAAESE